MEYCPNCKAEFPDNIIRRITQDSCWTLRLDSQGDLDLNTLICQSEDINEGCWFECNLCDKKLDYDWDEVEQMLKECKVNTN